MGSKNCINQIIKDYSEMIASGETTSLKSLDHELLCARYTQFLFSLRMRYAPCKDCSLCNPSATQSLQNTSGSC